MKITSAILFSLMLTTTLLASEKTDMDWSGALSLQKIDPAEQAYCYTSETGEKLGVNLDMKVRLASVSKLVTSLWAIEELGPQHRFNTKLFINGNKLFINGSYDPFMGNEKMFFLISELNKKGYTKFDSITFDRFFVLYPNAQGYVEDYPSLTPEVISKYLMTYFNTKNWTPAMKREYDRIAGLSKGKMNKTVTFEAGSASVIAENPFEGETETTKLTLSSPPLYRYLKEMNVQSNNYVAQTIFNQLGGVLEFIRFVDDRFSLTKKEIYFWTGSGLPVEIKGERKDNYATCSVILSFISALKDTAERQGRTLQDFVAVPGSDGGTFSNRVFPADYKNAFMAKTGTLMHTSALAGAMNTQKGFNYYGIFNQSKDIEGSKIVQNKMVKSIMTEMGGPLAFNYTVPEFNTYTDMKGLLSQMPKSEFLPFEAGLD